MEPKSLSSLPDELVLDVVEYLDAARDVASLASSSRHTHRLIRQDGWKTFVKAHFPSYTIRPNEHTQWSSVADRLTYLDRCWEKRGLWVNVYFDKIDRSRFRYTTGQSISFITLLDARMSPSLEHEVLAVGAGEKLLVRMGAWNSKKPDVWHTLEGKPFGYRPGTGDVTALSMIERHDTLEVVIGRADGSIQIVSANDTFSQPQQHLSPVTDIELDRAVDSRQSPGKLAISWTEWQEQSNLIASCKSTVLSLYDLADSKQELSPVAFHDFSRDSATGDVALLRAAKFLSKDTVACALGGSMQPLRYGKIRPSGLEFVDAAWNTKPLGPAGLLSDAQYGKRTTVRAIEVVGGSENTILSAWQDGTFRVNDVRTPSPYDAVYRDPLEPFTPGDALLVFGGERFVVGRNGQTNPSIIDFRYPKSYFHQMAALPCSPELPFPLGKWAKGMGKPEPEPVDQCHFKSGGLCTWHEYSRADLYRPDASVYMGPQGGIFSLAKSSDLANSFYCGTRGGLVEVNLQLTDQIDAEQISPTLPLSWDVERPGPQILLLETGIGRCFDDGWTSNGTNEVPYMVPQIRKSYKDGEVPERVRRHRLDSGFQQRRIQEHEHSRSGPPKTQPY